jgi:tetrahydromethanopterin S-methyltransferase subunit G
MFSVGTLFPQKKDVVVSYTLGDRERLIRLEVKLDEMSKSTDYRFDAVNKRLDAIDKRFESIDKRFESIDKHFDRIENALYGLIYSIFGLIGVFIAVLVWDRRKTLYPVQLDIINVR